MGGEGGGAAVPVGGPGPDVPLRDGGVGVLGIVVQAVIAVVVDLHLDGVGLACVIGRCRIQGLDGGRLALIRVLGAVDPHLGGAVGAHRGAAVGAVLLPVAGGDDEAELVVLAVEVEHGDLAPAVGAGEGVMLGIHIAAVHIGAPHVHAAVVRGGGGLVVHDEAGLASDGFGVAHGGGLIDHTHMGDAGVGVVVAAAIRVLPAVGLLVMEHEVDLLALGVDGGGVVALRVERHIGFRLAPVVAETVVDFRGLPLGVRGLVVDGDAPVVGQDVVLFLAHVGIGRIGGSGGRRVGGLGRAGIQGDGGVRRDGGLDLAALDGHCLGAVHGGVHVAVLAVGEGGRVGGVLVLLAVVDGDEALVSTGEGDVVAAVILPIGDLGAVDVVAEGDHATGGCPTLLAVPIGIVGGAGLVHIHVGHGGRGRTGGAVVVDVPLVVGQQTRGAVVVGQHEGVGQLVLGAVLIGQRALVAGGVPVGDEHVGVLGGKILAQAVAQALEVGDLALEGLVHLGLEAEFGHGAVLHVVARLDAGGFGGVADDLLDPVDVVGVLADLLGELLLDGLHAIGVDVFDGIHTEAAHAQIPQLGEVVGLDVLHLLAFGVEVPHGAQAAFLHFLLIGVVGDVPIAFVEVGGGDALRVLLGGEARVAAGGAVVVAAGHALLVPGGHVGAGGLVEHHVGDDAHACRGALLDHVLEFGFRAQLGVELIAHGLVAGPPLRALDGFLRRRDLHIGHAFRAIGVGAFLGDGVPRLLERDHLDVFLAGGCGLFGLGDARNRDQRRARHRGDDTCRQDSSERPLSDHASLSSSSRFSPLPHGATRLADSVRIAAVSAYGRHWPRLFITDGAYVINHVHRISRNLQNVIGAACRTFAMTQKRRAPSP